MNIIVPSRFESFYEGIHLRRTGRLCVHVHRAAGKAGEVLKHHVHHSPDGFECGYDGSGPADLALALAVDVIGPELDQFEIFKGRVGARAWAVHQRLKSAIVAGLPRTTGWIVQQRVVREAIEKLERRAEVRG